jgi:hypothetical protein
MYRFFSNTDNAQTLIDWASRVEALGIAIEGLDSEDYQNIIPVLGQIVHDYGYALKSMLELQYSNIHKAIGKCDDLDVIDIEQSYERARIVNVNAPDPSMRTEEIQEVLEKIEAFKKRVSPVFEIESELKKAAGRRVA